LAINRNWDIVITPRKNLFDIDLRSIWNYKNLIAIFVKRDFVAYYKQTILGPLWYVINPLVTTLVFTVIFGRVAKIPTDGTPPFIFYMAGTVCWNYFSLCLKNTSNIFVKNANLFGKVFFPRLTVPISVILISLLQFAIQMGIFSGFLMYFIIKGSSVSPNSSILFLPLLILLIGLQAFGMGILMSALTAKYRDLTYAMDFGIQLWMYATPIVYPLSVVPDNLKILFWFNPMTIVIESFRFMFLGQGTIEINGIIISILITLSFLLLGILMFFKIERTFMDTV
tara:strand:+ start:33 stop:881 length:849 start_codon:yes stop_codon:yes gene_type:complete